jgi:putative addiction module component (TIGR02574 family)
MDSKRLIDEALRLPADARAALAGELLESLDGEKVDADREAAWAGEIRNRLDAWERGEDKAMSEDEFLARLDDTVRGKPTT